MTGEVARDINIPLHSQMFTREEKKLENVPAILNYTRLEQF